MDPLELEVRKKIYDCIVNSPGIHFREIQRRTGTAVGNLDYHLHFLRKRGIIRAEQSAKLTRYYPMTKNWSEEEKQILSLLRQRNIRHIVLHLLTHRKAMPRSLAEALGVSNSTMSWYLKQMTEKNVIAYTKKGRFRTYRLTEPEKMVNYLVVYRASFLDELVDNFIDTWGEK
ncbi:MAG: winged helix-turn-helix transcriptional regulator [Candidatus Aenigmarchaeota archaeon]|nr:winged helix-turn-helix transcriptional regulator [Candidatus Aenigmarchaeota archaeon]